MQEQLDRIEVKLAELEGKLDKTYQSAEKMRRYFLIALGITVAAVIIPLLLLPAVIPSFLASQGVGL